LYAADRPVRRLSKGLLQRTGLAAALVSDPELVILDEPMSGLDPVGRKVVRELISSVRDNGRTIFCSTHLLSDVVTLCDRVAILKKGKVVVSGKLSHLLRDNVHRTEVTLHSASPEFEAWCKQQGHSLKALGEHLTVEVEGRDAVTPLLQQALKDSLMVVQVIPRHETLEDLFVREAIEHDDAQGAPS
jgi:ABC-2 type transport system ATP-binding protein